MSDDLADSDVPMPLAKRLVRSAILVAVLLVAAYGLMHVSIPAIRSGEAPPVDHFNAPCAFCHVVGPAKTPAVRS
jgi:hypothetical protein